MKVTIKSLGCRFSYPYGPDGPYHMHHGYLLTTDTGLIDKIEETDEPIVPEGVYDMTMDDFIKMTSTNIKEDIDG